MQSVSKCLKVYIFWYFGSRTVLSVCFPETLSLYINHQSNVWTMTKESYNLYVYFIIAIFSNQFYAYLKLKMARNRRGEVPSEKKKKHIAYFKLNNAKTLKTYFLAVAIHQNDDEIMALK